MIERDVNAFANPSNEIPKRAAHASAGLVLSNLHDSPSCEGVKLMLPAKRMADTIRMSDAMDSSVNPIVVCCQEVMCERFLFVTRQWYEHESSQCKLTMASIISKWEFSSDT